MDSQEREKVHRIYSKGKRNYIIRHGMLNWGVSTGIIFRILYIIQQEGLKLAPIREGLLTISTVVSILIFALLGAAWGAFFWKWIEKEATKPKPKSKKGKKP